MKNLSIYIHSASQCLTDHQSHGEGLICFSLLNGLAKRGHKIYAYARHSDILEKSENFQVKTGGKHLVPFDSLASWEHLRRGDKLLHSLADEIDFDLVWYMSPCGIDCPSVPQTLGKPLVIGPLYYSWPENAENKAMLSKPRFGIGIRPLVVPLAQRGWQNTLEAASLIISCTPKQTETIHIEYPNAKSFCLPLIVEPPSGIDIQARNIKDKDYLNLVFVANLAPNKYPLVLCQAVKILKDNGLKIRATFLGDGVERTKLENYITQENLADVITLKGRVSNKEVYDYLLNADLLVSTSLGEPYGRNIAEAMCVGTPAICHNSGGPAEIVTNGVDGILVNDLTGEAFAQAIREIYHDPNLWQSLSKEAILKSRNWTNEAVLSRLEYALLELRTRYKNKVT
jgi:glycosyltransferase involved in cell wall biosynthesis